MLSNVRGSQKLDFCQKGLKTDSIRSRTDFTPFLSMVLSDLNAQMGSLEYEKGQPAAISSHKEKT